VKLDAEDSVLPDIDNLVILDAEDSVTVGDGERCGCGCRGQYECGCCGQRKQIFR